MPDISRKPPLIVLVFLLFFILLPASCDRNETTAASPSNRISTTGAAQPGKADQLPELIPFKTGEPPDELWGYRDRNGVVRIGASFGYADPFSDGLAPVWIKKVSSEGEVDGSWGYIDVAGRFINSARYEAAGAFKNGRALVLADGNFVFINADGDRIGNIVTSAEPMPLPPPSEKSVTLEAYGRQLGATTPEYELKAMPIPGERYSLLHVRGLRYGVTEIQETGWEGHAYILSIPNMNLKDGISLARRILGRTKYSDATAKEIFPGETVFEMLETIAGAEFIRIRPRKDHKKGIEIEHIFWAS